MNANEYQNLILELKKLKRDEAHGRLYSMITGKQLLLSPSPESTRGMNFNEKLQWLMAYRYDKNVSLFADKLAVRDYVRACGFESILTRLYGVYRAAGDICVKALPKEFILKANHGSGPAFYSIRRDGESFDEKAELSKMDSALKLDFSDAGLEYHYHYIVPALMCEELIKEAGHRNPTDYKFFSFAGKTAFCKVITDRGNGVHQAYYDVRDGKWERVDLVKDNVAMENDIERPAALSEMTEIADVLSKPFPAARVDLYYVNGKVYFGEITLTPATGLNRTDKPEMLELLGSLTDVSRFDEKALCFKRTDEINRMYLSSLADKILTEKKPISKVEAQALMADCCKVMVSDFGEDVINKYMFILYELAFREDILLEEAWQIYWNINRLLFVNHNLCMSNNELYDLYIHILNGVKECIDYSGMPYRQMSERNQKCVVMTTSQFLTVGHAPTTRLLDYSYTLQHDLGYKVVIINDSGMHYPDNPHLSGVITFNYRPELNDASFVEHKGERFEFLQVGALMPDVEIIQSLLEVVYDLNPVMVYNIGGSSLFSDLCSSFVTTACLPCSFQMPVTDSDFLVVGRKLEAQSEDKSAPIKVDYKYYMSPEWHKPSQKQIDAGRMLRMHDGQKVIETNFNYIFRPSDAVYSRAQFGIPEEAFLACVVGNRLDLEINDEFIALFDKLANTDNADIHIAVVGEMNRSEEITAGLSDKGKEKIHFLGGLMDAGEFIRHCNITMNPDRSGGGRAAFEGYHYGIPSASLRKGDAYFCGGYEMGADDYEDYCRLVLKYASDAEYYAAMSRFACKRAAELSDMEGTLERQLEQILI